MFVLSVYFGTTTFQDIDTAEKQVYLFSGYDVIIIRYIYIISESHPAENKV